MLHHFEFIKSQNILTISNLHITPYQSFLIDKNPDVQVDHFVKSYEKGI